MPPEEPPGPGKPLSTPHAKGQRGALLAKKKRSFPASGDSDAALSQLGALGPDPGLARPWPARESLAPPQNAPRGPSTPRGGPASLRPAPCTQAWAAKGRPDSSRSPRSRGGASPFPHSPRLARVHSASRGERARVASRHPRLQERYSRLRAGAGGTHRTYLLDVHLSAPSAGEKVSPPRSNSATAGSGEEPTRPLPRSAARSPPAKQNGGAREGGVRASDGTTLAFLTKRRGSRGPVCSLLLAKGASYGVCRWISFDASICS